MFKARRQTVSLIAADKNGQLLPVRRFELFAGKLNSLGHDVLHEIKAIVS
jgi:hypothetical protein